MTPFVLRDGVLCAERVPLSEIASRFGTPCYVYSRAALERAWREFDAAFASVPHLVCYAMKANPNLAVLNLFARLGSGFDIVSGGELERVLAAGGDPSKVVFSGVGKSEAEMEAALRVGILCFNVESASELTRLNAVAGRVGRVAPVSFRVNPDVDPMTHPYISTGLKESKFGIAFADAPTLYRLAASLPNIAVRGLDIHIGSQITEISPYREAADKVLELVDRLAADGIALTHIDLGGEKLIFEPGRLLVGDAGVLLTRVEYLKPGNPKSFAIVDAAMNDLLRPALYDAWHPVSPVRPRAGAEQRWDIVGPVCESGDFLAHDRSLAIAEGDLLAIGAAGAYGMAMSSNYNARPRACELIVDDSRVHLVRQRERADALFAGESLLP